MAAELDILLLQMAIVRGNPALNRAKVLALTTNLRPAKSSLLILPELFSTGFLDESSLSASGPASGTPGPASGTPGSGTGEGPKGNPSDWESLAGQDDAFLSDLARRLGCWVAGATVECEPARGRPVSGPRFRNVSLLFGPYGEREARYQKIHPFSYGGEDRVFTRGNDLVTVQAEGWILQPTVCYDLRFPELYRAGSLRGVHLILVQANWPEARQAHWETLLRARAIENQAFVAGVNCTGSQDSLAFAGGSMLVSPKGEVVIQAGDAEGVSRGRADLDACLKWRKQFAVLPDRMPWEFYQS